MSLYLLFTAPKGWAINSASLPLKMPVAKSKPSRQENEPRQNLSWLILVQQSFNWGHARCKVGHAGTVLKLLSQHDLAEAAFPLVHLEQSG